jgi:hypothetical protein
MSSIIRTARAVFSILSPLTGGRSAGTALLHAVAGDIAIEANRPLYGIPLRGNGLDYDAMVKTVGAAVVTAAGTSVPIRSVVGGHHVNLPAGTVIRWDPQVPGLAHTATIEAPGLTLGLAPTFFGGVHQMKMHEQLGPADVAQQLFECKVGRFPALVLLWDSSTPAGEANGRRGVGVRLIEERWLLAIVASRVDSSEQRRQEALQILEDARELLTDRAETEDHEIFSAPAGILVSACKRIVVSNTSYVYGIGFSTTHALARREWRTFNPWLRTRVVFPAGELDFPMEEP